MKYPKVGPFHVFALDDKILLVHDKWSQQLTAEEARELAKHLNGLANAVAPPKGVPALHQIDKELVKDRQGMNKRKIIIQLLATLADSFVDEDWSFNGHTVEMAVQDLKKEELRVQLTGGLQLTLKPVLEKLKKVAKA